MSEPQEPNWERTVLEKLALSALQEQRRSRHWSILFKTLGFLYLFIVLFLAAGWFGGDGVAIPKEHTALIDLQGVIASDDASADTIISSLQGAFEDKKTKGVILRINSPGGSPVQAGQIYDEIKRLRALHPKTPLYVVVDDICASGGYYVAAGADKIFVDKASIVGSIGVLMDGFGFTQTMEKLGVERRLLTAGENKGFLDPFSPLDPKQQAFAKQMLEEIHGQFIGVVREGRGKRLKETPEMFSGLVWSGEKSIQLGLADGLGSVESVARDVIKAEDIVDYTQQDSLVERLAGRLGATMAKAWSPFEKSGVALR
ncbi:MAG: S49 family peptidase [Gammaproteobacteria bacterium]|jgi:protease-4|nr:S49 family peptidase [Gammaproteobacteria bacterium]MBU1408037.1 S49 family peptidase [Gammaproteobacteria bacterium]MBU1532600.1 S49 family peptidase [Gammaproteobacteria bacterium]